MPALTKSPLRPRAAGAVSHAVRLRSWPHPYPAALAICNDIDCTTWPDFLEIHRFLNTTRSTPFGDGLGLPIGDSYWLYTVRPDNDPGFAYFDELDGRPSPLAPRMRELMHAGVLNVLHTYGNFSQRGGFRRYHAERAAAELNRWNVHPLVWVNHGDCHNFQNIHGPSTGETFAGGRKHRCGTDGVPVANLEYHLDITHRLGIRYLWVHELVQDIGQDRPLSAWEHHLRGNAIKTDRWLRRDAKEVARAWLDRNGHGVPRGMVDNRLLRQHPLDPGPFYRFRRFGRFGPDCMSHLPLLLADAQLDALADSGGVMILFAHLGKRPEPTLPVFTTEAANALRGLARRHHEGNLYVETTSRLLYYVTVRDHLEWSVQDAGDHVIIDIKQVCDPVIGTFRPRVNDLAGICFEVRGEKPPAVRLSGRPTLAAQVERKGRTYFAQFPPNKLDVGDLLE